MTEGREVSCTSLWRGKQGRGMVQGREGERCARIMDKFEEKERCWKIKER